MADSGSTSSLDSTNVEGGALADIPGNEANCGRNEDSAQQTRRPRSTGHGSDSKLMLKLRDADNQFQQGQYLNAFRYFQRALKLQKKAARNDAELLKTERKMAACRFKSDLQQPAVENLKKAIDESIQASATDGLRREQVTALVLLAMIYHFLGDYQLEVSSYKRALEIARKSGAVAAEMEPTLQAYFTQAIANSEEERPSPDITTVTLEDGEKPQALVEIEKLFVDNRGIAQPDSTVDQAYAFRSADDSVSIDSRFPGEHTKDDVSTTSAQHVNDASDVLSVDPRVPTSEVEFMSAGGTVQRSVEPQAPYDNDSTSFSSMPASQPVPPPQPAPRPPPQPAPQPAPRPAPRKCRQPQ